MVSEIHLGPKSRVAEGKTKIIYAVLEPRGSDWEPTSELAYMVHKDAITAGDGEKRDVIEGKGVLSCRTTSAVFRYLERQGIPTHYVDTLDERTMLVRRVEMIPIEWVARRLATGSYVRRTGVAEGTRFDPIILEQFLKDDLRHDPQITVEEAVSSGLCTEDEGEQALQLTERVFLALERAWEEQDIQLVDLKIELGRVPDGLVVADVIDNDSWRLWPGGRREAMLDKQVYRNLAVRDADALKDVRRRYVEVAERAERLGSASVGRTEVGDPLG
jgi:phosphoribosylaminoimidazole-succinocarboxamide synthase